MAKTSGPFQGPPPVEWRERFASALAATSEVNLPSEAIQLLTAYVPNPKNYVSRDPNGNWQLKSGALRTINTGVGELTYIAVEIVGFAATPWPYNERTSTTWRSPADPACGGARPFLPSARTWTEHTANGAMRSFAALQTDVESVLHMSEILDRAETELEKGAGRRQYNLIEDMAQNGQLEPGLLVFQEYVVPQSQGRRFVALAAVGGNNRASACHRLHDLTSAEVVGGVPRAKLGLEGSDIAINPVQWLARYAAVRNQEVAEAQTQDVAETSAVRAAKVATVPAHIVVGVNQPDRLQQIVQSSNRRTHAHPPLEFQPNDRSRSVGRGVIASFAEGGLIDQMTAEVLMGDRSVTDMPGVDPNASVSALRDLRSMKLLELFFPTKNQQEARRRLRAALSEPSSSNLGGEQVRQRMRAWSALTSMSYPEPWNPRVADVLGVAAAKDGISLSMRSLHDLLDVAADDATAFEELVVYRAPHWLAAYDIVDADRGSMGAQAVRKDAADPDADDVETERRIRRGVTNAINAMRADRPRAIALLREIAAAMDEGREPRRIDDGGMVGDAPASQRWFDDAFPKVQRGRGRPAPITMQVASAPIVTPATQVRLLATDLRVAVDSLKETALTIPELVHEIQKNAEDAGGVPGLSQAVADELALKVTNIIRLLRELPELIIDLT
ncbi:hypothetical protein [Krasilnikovia sp. MM14-A1004]|uniref:hypothetical protein n=1 Tax=Krasilnikovia sp. MM14-A1004 TaxID=3373541 RepID=UPI00399C59F4